MTIRDGTHAPLALVRSLFEALNAAEVRYCHWKSTTTLGRALAGRTDLDLLVDSAHVARFREVVSAIGFKPFVSHPSRRYPGVEDHLGCDPDSGRLVHLHVYQQLILGEHYVKNHVLPLENALLDDTVIRDGVRIPPPHVELMILILRGLLKYRDTDAAKDLLRLGRRGGLPPDLRAEVRDLAGRTSVEDVVAVAHRELPSVASDVFSGFLEVVARNPRDAVSLLRLRRAARHGLRPFQRVPARQALTRYVRARLVHTWPIKTIARRLSRHEMRRKSSARGGLTIAVVGADGAGKSTVVGALQEWLGWRLNLRVLYLGTARPSPLTAVMQGISRAARRVVPGWGGAKLIAALRYLAEARDRSRRSRIGRQLAVEGVVVVFDRYPLDYVRMGERAMDGPRIGTIPGATTSRLLGRLARIERDAYARMPRPDLVVLLDVPASVAMARKPSRRPESILEKATAISAAVAGAHADVVTVDATRPLPEVLAGVREAVWSRL